MLFIIPSNLKHIIKMLFVRSLFKKKYNEKLTKKNAVVKYLNHIYLHIFLHHNRLATSGHMITLYTTTTVTTALFTLQPVCMTITLCNKYMCTCKWGIFYFKNNVSLLKHLHLGTFSLESHNIRAHIDIVIKWVFFKNFFFCPPPPPPQEKTPKLFL